MDLFTTSFFLSSPPLIPFSANLPDGSSQTPTEALQRLASEIGSREGCLLTVTPASRVTNPTTTTTTYNSSNSNSNNPPASTSPPSSASPTTVASTSPSLLHYPSFQQSHLRQPAGHAYAQPQPQTQFSYPFPNQPRSPRRSADESYHQTRGYNILISGTHAQVLHAKGAFLRDCQRSIVHRIKVPRSDVLDSPSAAIINQDSFKPGVQARLDDISTLTGASVTVSFDQTASSALGNSARAQGMSEDSREKQAFGLETERTCGIIVEGESSSVDAAKVRVLVFLDELTGLHSASCEIDYKLHSIIAGRKRQVIQTIQEETGTNIYFPTASLSLLPSSMPPSSPLSALPPSPSMPSPLLVRPFGGPGGPIPLPPPGQQSNVRPFQPGHNRTNLPYLPPPPLSMPPQPSASSSPASSSLHPHAHSQPMNAFTPPHRNMLPYPQSQLQQAPGSSYPAYSVYSNPYGPSPQQQQQQQQGGYTGFPGAVSAGAGAGVGISIGPGPVGGRAPGGGIEKALRLNGNGPWESNQSAQMTGPGSGSGEAKNTIWITGEFFGVQRARDMIYQIAGGKIRSKCIISRDTPILPRKLDWLATERVDEVRGIMIDNGTFIQFPTLGSQGSLITVFGDSRVVIERTIRSVMALACQFLDASFWLLPLSFDVLMPSNSINPIGIQPALLHIANASGAEVVWKSNCFEFHGLEGPVRLAVGMALDLEEVKNFHREIRFQIELANEHREFISGKKNGKINKIMKMENVKIKFETFNDYNFLMDLAGNDTDALSGLSMLQEELPAEVSFHVPESYHKRIIGVGGKNIQRIMKKYGVYVKFSNAEEFALLGGYEDNTDNVVARTPAKNAMNLEQLKQSVMELVSPKDKDYIVETVSIPRRYHRTLLGEKSIFIHDIESKTNSTIRFPHKETASDVVTIYGPESQAHIAAAMLLDHVPFEADLHVPFSMELASVLGTPEFVQLIERINREAQVAIVPPARIYQQEQGEDSVFKFKCQRSNLDFLGPAKDALEEYLLARKILIYPSDSHAAPDSYADAFSHFNSALLPSKFNIAETEVPTQGESLVQRRLRPAASAQDVKALFNSTQTFYTESSFQNQSTSDDREIRHSPERPSRHIPSVSLGGSGGGSNSLFSGSTPYEPPRTQGRNGLGHRQQLSDLWIPTQSQTSQTRASNMGHERSQSSQPTLSTILSSMPPPPVPTSAPRSPVEEISKRDSDSTLAAKMREIGSVNRSGSNRAQSLDMTSLTYAGYNKGHQQNHQNNQHTHNHRNSFHHNHQGHGQSVYSVGSFPGSSNARVNGSGGFSPPGSARSSLFPGTLEEQFYHGNDPTDELDRVISSLHLS
ncbi:cytoplasmic protein [Phaffia rhodozyma]|uniref:Cytoplasmic protein n=1 Tax=Phaffia rhodozyma TaxID=264483 RepID=A0A0F7SQ98_PHARH|nr:cytoplasmic protein [Phaffia rhodozyma]